MSECTIVYIMYWSMHGLMLPEQRPEPGYLQVISLLFIDLVSYICIWFINKGEELPKNLIFNTFSTVVFY